MNKFLFKVTFFILAFILSFQASANPISKEEAQAWLDRASKISGIPVDRLEETFKSNEAKARETLKSMPSSMAFNRDLADSLHRLGHLAEHEHSYDKARKLHLESYEHYQKSGVLKSQGSSNGLLHAVEHIFMDYYDEAVLRGQKDQDDKAEILYGYAYKWAQQYLPIEKLMEGSPRFPQRYLGLLLYRAENLKSLTATDEKILNSSCSFHLLDPNKATKK